MNIPKALTYYRVVTVCTVLIDWNINFVLSQVSMEGGQVKSFLKLSSMPLNGFKFVGCVAVGHLSRQSEGEGDYAIEDQDTTIVEHKKVIKK